ncbi:hypothetical protein ACLE2W_06820 [Pseudomonas shahriarae]|uniref:hypothetical protein n=1 Tax=Pseudomonas shahriarae TaxID=2745512 RepID=UPI00207672EF|nr:hypothetical protein [Pseudomonas shahriarae]MCM8559836.1 hypothetical protein [Pseudomonas shahriarae]
MSEVERYWIDPGRLVQEGWHPDDTCVVKDWAYDRVVAERDGLHVSLNTADQTIDDLNAAVSRRTHRVRELEAQLACAVDALNEVVKVSAMHEKPFEIATLAIGELSASAQLEVKP